jgi:hypothetical protein
MTFSNHARRRWDVAARTLAAIGGGYLFTALATTLLAVHLPVPRADAAIIGTMLSFAIYSCTVLWVFAVRSALYAWMGILGTGGPLAVWLWISGSMQ